MKTFWIILAAFMLILALGMSDNQSEVVTGIAGLLFWALIIYGIVRLFKRKKKYASATSQATPKKGPFKQRLEDFAEELCGVAAQSRDELMMLDQQLDDDEGEPILDTQSLYFEWEDSFSAAERKSIIQEEKLGQGWEDFLDSLSDKNSVSETDLKRLRQAAQKLNPYFEPTVQTEAKTGKIPFKVTYSKKLIPDLKKYPLRTNHSEDDYDRDPEFAFQVQGSDAVYTVVAGPHGRSRYGMFCTCNCQGFFFNGSCQHIFDLLQGKKEKILQETKGALDKLQQYIFPELEKNIQLAQGNNATQAKDARRELQFLLSSIPRRIGRVFFYFKLPGKA